MVGEQCPQQGLPAGRQLADEVPQSPGDVGVDDALFGASEGISHLFQRRLRKTRGALIMAQDAEAFAACGSGQPPSQLFRVTYLMGVFG